jgi:hypothetical protein
MTSSATRHSRQPVQFREATTGDPLSALAITASVCRRGTPSRKSSSQRELRARRPVKSPGTAPRPRAYSQAHSPDPRQKDTIGLCPKNCEAKARTKYIPASMA